MAMIIVSERAGCVLVWLARPNFSLSRGGENEK